MFLCTKGVKVNPICKNFTHDVNKKNIYTATFYLIKKIQYLVYLTWYVKRRRRFGTHDLKNVFFCKLICIQNQFNFSVPFWRILIHRFTKKKQMFASFDWIQRLIGFYVTYFPRYNIKKLRPGFYVFFKYVLWATIWVYHNHACQFCNYQMA